MVRSRAQLPRGAPDLHSTYIPDESTADNGELTGHAPCGQVAHCTRDDLLRIMYDHPEDGKRVRMHTLKVALRRFIVRSAAEYKRAIAEGNWPSRRPSLGEISLQVGEYIPDPPRKSAESDACAATWQSQLASKSSRLGEESKRCSEASEVCHLLVRCLRSTLQPPSEAWHCGRRRNSTRASPRHRKCAAATRSALQASTTRRDLREIKARSA